MNYLQTFETVTQASVSVIVLVSLAVHFWYINLLFLVISCLLLVTQQYMSLAACRVTKCVVYSGWVYFSVFYEGALEQKQSIKMIVYLFILIYTSPYVLTFTFVAACTVQNLTFLVRNIWFMPLILLCFGAYYFYDQYQIKSKEKRVLSGLKAALITKDDAECSICIEGLNRDAIQLQCGHQFHFECIRTWF